MREKIPAIVRFWRHTKASSTGCIEWTGALDSGYGVFGYEGSKTARAHRWLFQRVFGPLPSSIDVMHSCDNRACVALQHLSPGTRKANMADAANKGRMPRGERSVASTLSDAEVIEMRERTLAGESLAMLAASFGVSLITVHQVVTGRTWKHVGGPLRALRQRPAGLSDEQVRMIRKLKAGGLLHREIAERVSVSSATVSRIAAGKRRNDVK